MRGIKCETIQWGLKVSYLLFSLLLFSVLITGCSKETPSGPSPDPPGTVTSKLRLQGYGANAINFETGAVYIAATADVILDASSNFCAALSDGIADVGSVSGVGDITSIPTEGWVKSCAAIVGHGYAVKTEEGNIYRVYAESYILNIYEEVIGFTIKWIIFTD